MAVDYKLEVGPGWHKLLESILYLIEGKGTILQVKEKFGELRIYWRANDDLTATQSDIINSMLTYVEWRSGQVCENTGEPGSVRNINGWLKCVSEVEYQRLMKKEGDLPQTLQSISELSPNNP